MQMVLQSLIWGTSLGRFHHLGKDYVELTATRCLNKLDAGVDERILLTSRDEQTTFVVTYKELKKQVTAAFTDLGKSTKSART